LYVGVLDYWEAKLGPQLENIPWWGKNILREANIHLGRQKYKYNKINNNSENFNGMARLLLRGEVFAP